MRIIFTFLVALSVFTVACKQNASADKAATTTTEVSKPVTPTWAFKTKEDEMGNPRTQIFLVLKDTMKVADATSAFHELTQAEYADKKIPKESVIACSGFWAGLEHQYILLDSSNTWVIKLKMIDEGSDGKETFEKVTEFKK